MQGGYARAAGGTQRGPVGAIYPRVDPAVIVAATCAGDWLLLGRKKAWDKGRYSLLAGEENEISAVKVGMVFKWLIQVNSHASRWLPVARGPVET